MQSTDTARGPAGRLAPASLAALALVVVLASVGVAAVPDDGGVIHACYKRSNGNVRILDSNAKGCSNDESPISWNQSGGTGPQGPAGPMGPQGPFGPMGPMGPAGPEGPQGFRGLDGAQGPPGLDGAQGPPGLDGAEGPQGIPGPQGPQGAEGPAGPAGPQGIPGLSGYAVATRTLQLVPDSSAIADVSCANGKFVLSAGARSTSINYGVTIAGSYPTSNSTWRFELRNPYSMWNNVTLFAVCALVSG